MAGVVPRRSTSGRKQWTLHDGPRSSLNRLRNQLATDGCPASQVVLGKHLLQEECETEDEAKQKARSGVYWIIKASEQGNEEATEILKTCLETGKGICDLNYLDVKSCITMSQSEKLARLAARQVFARLSNGGDYITSDQLQRRILAIDKGNEASGLPNGHASGELVNDYENIITEFEEDWLPRSDASNEKLTEDHLISAAIEYSHGHIPIVSRILCLSQPNLNVLDHIPFVHRSVLHPVLLLKILYYKLFKRLGQQFHNFLPIAKETQLLVLMLIYTLVSTENILYFFPMLIYYVSFIIMLITTIQMLQNKRDLVDFRMWSGLFLCYSGGRLKTESAENIYVLQNLRPYGHFFAALIANLLIYPIIVEQWIPQSELTIISFCLTFMTLWGFMPKRRSKTVFDMWILFSFAVNVLAKYPYETDPVVARGWRFLDLKVPTFASYIVGNGIEFCINFRMFLFAGIPLLFIRIASKESWTGVHKALIPHCVTLSWLQICIISSQGATMYGLLRGTLALVGFVLFLPLVGLTSIIVPAAALTNYIITSNILYTLSVFICFTALGLVICRIGALSRYSEFTVMAQFLVLSIAILSLIDSFYYNSKKNEIDYSNNKEPEFLSWEIYQRFCHQPIWQEENVAVAQIKCAELQNSYVQWDGYIIDIKVKSIENFWQKLFDKFPASMKHYLYCSYGDKVNNHCNSYPDLVRGDCVSFHNAIKSYNRCTLQKFNVYTFEIVTKMHSGIWGRSPEVSIIVNDFFKNFTLNLKPNDHIWFKGTLFNNELAGSDGVLGGRKTHVLLEEIGCLACINNELSDVKIKAQDPLIVRVSQTIMLGVKFMCNVVFNPMIVFK